MNTMNEDNKANQDREECSSTGNFNHPLAVKHLVSALRQYCLNDSTPGFVAGYDFGETNKIVAHLIEVTYMKTQSIGRLEDMVNQRDKQIATLQMELTSIKPAQQERVRMLRVLEYEGSREFVEVSLKQRTVRSELVLNSHGKVGERNTIREAILGEFPTILTQPGDSRYGSDY